MMYYRRKILLSLLQQFGNTLARTDFQKLLFLFSEDQAEKSYYFIPYKFGCFSLQANQDISTLSKYGLIDETEEGIVKTTPKNYSNELKMHDRIKLTNIFNKYSNIRGTELIREVYKNYPYYAINSEIAEDLMSEKDMELIKSEVPVKSESIIFSVGYEGKSVEQYFNLLIQNNIKVLIDVRKNAFSMKYGYSKNQLLNVCNNIDIQYLHIPELGIESIKRKKLNTKYDYIKLFDEYECNTLNKSEEYIKNIYELLLRHKRIALLCFEADPEFCHRTKILNRVVSMNKEDCNIIER